MMKPDFFFSTNPPNQPFAKWKKGRVSQNNLRRAQGLQFGRPIWTLSEWYRFRRFHTIFIPCFHLRRFQPIWGFMNPVKSERVLRRFQQRFFVHFNLIYFTYLYFRLADFELNSVFKLTLQSLQVFRIIL